jgi:hypothetical protein
MSTQPLAAEAPWRIGLRGARANLCPGLALQVVALVLVLAYYRHEPTHAALERLSELRRQTGFLFGIISTGLFGGLIPLLYLKSRRATRARYTWAQGAALTAFWAYKGIEVDLFYRFLARAVGEQPNFATVTAKMLIDQFLYCPIIAVPVTVVVYGWAGGHFEVAPVIADIRAGGWYRRRVLPVLISNLGVWIPAVCIIYALPTPLQLPLQNLVLCFFTLLLAHVTERRK